MYIVFKAVVNKIKFLCLIVSSCAYSFNWKKCDRNWLEETMGAGVIVSTTSFISSTGDCAMIGEKSHDEKVYFAQNFEEIKIDVARGGGEYLTAFTKYGNCSNFDLMKFSKNAQENFEVIYSEKIESSFVKLNLMKGKCTN